MGQRSKKMMAYRDYLTATEGQLAHPGRQSWGGRPELEETVTRWRDRTDLDPGTIPEDISKLEWRQWQAKFEIYVKASTEGGNPSEALRQTSLQSKLDAFLQG